MHGDGNSGGKVNGDWDEDGDENCNGYGDGFHASLHQSGKWSVFAAPIKSLKFLIIFSRLTFKQRMDHWASPCTGESYGTRKKKRNAPPRTAHLCFFFFLSKPNYYLGYQERKQNYVHCKMEVKLNGNIISITSVLINAYPPPSPS